jgi:hypothetical protein
MALAELFSEPRYPGASSAWQVTQPQGSFEGLAHESRSGRILH